MKKKTKYILGGLIVLFAIAIFNNGEDTTSEDTSQHSRPSSISKLRTSYQEAGKNTNYMTLYYVSSTESPDSILQLDITQIAESTKANANRGVFHYAVIFDDSTYAKFPETPFTAEFGMEEDKLKHIKAIYTYNKINDYSELRIYKTNAWESNAERLKI